MCHFFALGDNQKQTAKVVFDYKNISLTLDFTCRWSISIETQWHTSPLTAVLWICFDLFFSLFCLTGVHSFEPFTCSPPSLATFGTICFRTVRWCSVFWDIPVLFVHLFVTVCMTEIFKKKLLSFKTLANNKTSKVLSSFCFSISHLSLFLHQSSEQLCLLKKLLRLLQTESFRGGSLIFLLRSIMHFSWNFFPQFRLHGCF